MMVLALWTIYDHPSDCPHLFVARKFLVDTPTSETRSAATLDELRRIVQDTGADVCITRDPSDDPVIVETWIAVELTRRDRADDP